MHFHIHCFFMYYTDTPKLQSKSVFIPVLQKLKKYLEISRFIFFACFDFTLLDYNTSYIVTKMATKCNTSLLSKTKRNSQNESEVAENLQRKFLLKKLRCLRHQDEGNFFVHDRTGRSAWTRKVFPRKCCLTGANFWLKNPGHARTGLYSKKFTKKIRGSISILFLLFIIAFDLS